MEVKTAQDAGLRTAAPPVPKNDEMPLLGIDHIELYVGNAIQATHYFTHALGFRETAYAGLETGMRDRASHLVEQGRIRFLLTTPLHGSGEICAKFFRDSSTFSLYHSPTLKAHGTPTRNNRKA